MNGRPGDENDRNEGDPFPNEAGLVTRSSFSTRAE